MRICADKVVGFDIDDSLISEDPIHELTVLVPFQGTTVAVAVNQELVDTIKSAYQSGKYVIAWSQSGDEWVDAVIKSLNLEHHVHLCMSKMSECYDDLPIKEWLKVKKVKF